MVGVIDISLGITERKAMNRRLLESEAKFRGIAERSYDSIFTVDMKGIITYASPAIHRILGYTPEEVMGTSMMSYVPESASSPALQATTELLDGILIEPFE